MGGDRENTELNRRMFFLIQAAHVGDLNADQKSLILPCQTLTMHVSDTLFQTAYAAFCNEFLLNRKQWILSCPAAADVEKHL